jgi:hypothetical protein
LEEFKVLAEFLNNSRNQYYVKLLSIDFTKSESNVEAAVLAAQINLLGAISVLPNVVTELRNQFAAIEKIHETQKESVIDPLDQEEV